MVEIDEASGTTILRRNSPYRPSGFWREWLIGRPLPTADAAHQTIGKIIGLAVFASDSPSSTAYATQERWRILAMAGTAAFGYAIAIALVIVGLNETIMLIVPQFVPGWWWHNLLHNQTAIMQRLALLFRRGIVITDVPFHLE
jgi:hypothetical protein